MSSFSHVTVQKHWDMWISPIWTEQAKLRVSKSDSFTIFPLPLSLYIYLSLCLLFSPLLSHLNYKWGRVARASRLPHEFHGPSNKIKEDLLSSRSNANGLEQNISKINYFYPQNTVSTHLLCCEREEVGLIQFWSRIRKRRKSNDDVGWAPRNLS